jgi:hypothetical protein
MLGRRGFVRLIGGGVVVGAAGAWSIPRLDPMPPEAIEAWAGPAADLEPRRWAVAHAILAPNPHNMQPWLVDLREPGAITLAVDTERLLPETDPFGRQVLIGQGTFLEILSMALAERGIGADVELFPQGAASADAMLDGRPVARLSLREGANVVRDPLFAQVLHRRTNKEPYDMARPVASDAAAALSATALPAGQILRLVTEPARVAELRTLTREAMEIELATPRTLKESIDRTRIGTAAIAAHRDGIDLHGPLFWFLRHAGLMTAEAAMTPGTMAWQGGRDYAMGYIEGTPAYGYLSTADNSRVTQLETGRAYVRLNLAATALGLAMHPNSQAQQEFAEMAASRQRLHAFAGLEDGQTVQILWRMGYAEAPGPSPRRRVDDLLVG